MAPHFQSAAQSAVDPAVVAAAWFAHFAVASLAAMPREEALPAKPLAVLAAFAAIALAEGRTLVILAPDDQQLPEISSALDLAIRPLCLVLPAADFAARIALRATLSLMKSRLAREGEDEQTAAWQRQRERIAENHSLWQEAHQWVARNDRSDWPEHVADLFPARILPIEAYRGLRQKTADITLLYRCDAPPELIAPPGGLLHVGTRVQAAVPTHSVTLADADQQLRMELAQLTQDVAELGAGTRHGPSGSRRVHPPLLRVGGSPHGGTRRTSGTARPRAGGTRSRGLARPRRSTAAGRRRPSSRRAKASALPGPAPTNLWRSAPAPM
jgi:hypothetical protein